MKDYKFAPSKVKAYRDFAKKVYIHNKKVGWWDEPVRPLATTIDLIHSELSEAMEAHRKDLMDDKLTDEHGVHAELADALIRTLDAICHYKQNTKTLIYFSGVLHYACEPSDFNCMNLMVRSALNKVYMDKDYEALWEVVKLLDEMAAILNFDILAIAKKKHEFNKTRADHTREARNGQNGKKY